MLRLTQEGSLPEEKIFTLEELAKYDGKDGKPAYLAFKGKVYDVTGSAFWEGGDHWGVHYAGRDLTPEIEAAPHGPENLDKMRLVGVLAS
jgi:predicted heme/steroid binding protein